MPSEKPVLMVVCGRSCGSIDWILPVLQAVTKSGRADVKVFFKSETTYQLLQTNFRDLAGVLESSTSEVLTKSRLLADLANRRRVGVLVRNTFGQIDPKRPLKALEKAAQLACQMLLLPFSRSVRRADRLADAIAASLLVDRLSERDVSFVFHDMPADVPIYSPGFRGAEIVYFQHGTLTFERLEDNWPHIQHMITQEPLDAIPKRTTWLIGRSREEKYYRRIGVACKMLACGHPKFDPRWSAMLKQRTDALSGQRTANQNKPRVLFLSMPAWKFSDASHRSRLLEQLFRVATKHDWDLRVKLHPDERPDDFLAVAAAVNCGKFQWCDTSVTGAATQVDFVVCFPTSAAMDAVAAGAPVIEFFDFGGQMHSSFVDACGTKTSIYRTEGLVESASTAGDLDNLATRATEDDGFLERLQASQHASLATLFVDHGSATDRILNHLSHSFPAANMSSPPTVSIVFANLKGNVGDFAILDAMIRQLTRRYPGRVIEVLDQSRLPVDDDRFRVFQERVGAPFTYKGPVRNVPVWSQTGRLGRVLKRLRFDRQLQAWQIRRVAQELETIVIDSGLCEHEAVYFAGGELWSGGELAVNMFGLLQALVDKDVRVSTFPFSVHWSLLKRNNAGDLRRYFRGFAGPILVRDGRSRATLERAGVESSLVPDVVFSLPPVRRPTPPERTRPRIGISVAELQASDQSSVRRMLTSLMSGGVDPVLVTTCVPEDGAVLEALAASLDLPLVKPLGWEDAVRELQSLDLLISNRLHGLIFAFLGGTPAIPLVNREKVAGLAEDAGLRRRVDRLEQVTPAAITGWLREVDEIVIEMLRYRNAVQTTWVGSTVARAA